MRRWHLAARGGGICGGGDDRSAQDPLGRPPTPLRSSSRAQAASARAASAGSPDDDLTEPSNQRRLSHQGIPKLESEHYVLITTPGQNCQNQGYTAITDVDTCSAALNEINLAHKSGNPSYYETQAPDIIVRGGRRPAACLRASRSAPSPATYRSPYSDTSLTPSRCSGWAR